MADKPKQASEYKSEQVELVRATCLYVATKLGDMMDDLIIVGGLVPSLIVDQTTLPQDVDTHVGTMDLDVGLQLALLDEGRYRKLTERLRDAGFAMDKNDDGNPTRQRWTITNSGTVTVDFLIPPSREGDRPGKLRDIEPDFAAIIAPGLRCAFRDRQHITLQGRTLFGEKAERDVWVCGAGAYVVLKALAFDSRGENKDAYDLFYIVRNFGAGIKDVVAKLQPLLDDEEARKALDVLRRDFTDPEGIGPMRVAEFITGRPDDEIQADVVGFVTALLDRCG
ncbi:MAG: hypothetical protein A2284_03330 [Deltaproteobacteria bacterium RIFOXYA12_FULL_61_11]|nr:MAG: hypothetical protein A2284_03330 [Deltaproteobacteria bacterium RIFOXYA12_FULL_61_11]